MKKTIRALLCFLLVMCTLAFLASCLESNDGQEPGTAETTTAADGAAEPQGTTEPQNTTAPDPCAAGHTYGAPEVIKLPCVEAGKQKLICSVCGDEKEEDIPATGAHEAKAEWEVVLEATRYTEGRRAKKCKGCGLEMQTEVIACELSNYSIIYDASIRAKLFGDSAKNLANGIGSSATVNSDSRVNKDNATAKEILIGETDRPESATALALVNGEGFAITYTDGKIAIVGTNSVQTICGVNYFIEKYLCSGSNDTVLPASEVKSIDQIEFMSSVNFGYTLVFGADLDNDPGTPFGYGGGRDYICTAVDDLISSFSSNTGMNRDRFSKITDADPVATKELIIGKVNRAEYQAIIEKLDANEYAISIKGDKVILAAWNNKAMQVCISDFEKLLKDVRESSGGIKVWNLPGEFYAKGVAVDAWETDFPRPDEAENIELTRSINANDDSLQFTYTGEGVSLEAFKAYCQKLTASGYTVVWENEIEGSGFKSLVNSEKGIVLHVIYDNYKYESNYFDPVKQAEEGANYLDYEKAIRVTSSPIDSITLPDSSILTPNPTYTKVADSTVTAIGYTHAYVGMCYIIRLEDGRFIIYDSGNGGCEGMIWNALVNLHTEAYGSAPSASNPIHVAAWIITHSHTDHKYGAKNLLKNYGTSKLFKMDYLIGTFPATSELYSSGGVAQDIAEMGSAGEIESWQALVSNGGAGSFKFIKAFTGQRLYFANLEIEILMTYEDHPSVIHNSNETSTVTRLTIETTNAAKGAATTAANTARTTTAIFLGDALRYQSRYLCNMYGDYLQSDIVQLAHHGNLGCESELYATIRPSVVLWPECSIDIEDYCNPSNHDIGYQYEVDQFVRYELDSVKYIYGSYEGYATTISLSTSNADYGSFYDAWTGEAKTHNGTTWIKVR